MTDAVRAGAACALLVAPDGARLLHRRLPGRGAPRGGGHRVAPGSARRPVQRAPAAALHARPDRRRRHGPARRLDDGLDRVVARVERSARRCAADDPLPRRADRGGRLPHAGTPGSRARASPRRRRAADRLLRPLGAAAPSLVELDRSESAAARLEQPLTYWNAMGVVAAIGLVLAARLVGDRSRPVWMRCTAAAASAPLGAAVYLTFSRGALVALLAGLALLALLLPRRGQLLAIGLTLGCAVLSSVCVGGLPLGPRTRGERQPERAGTRGARAARGRRGGGSADRAPARRLGTGSG